MCLPRTYIGEYETAGSAITRVVDDEAGLVVDSNGNTIYRCLAADSYNTVADEIKEICFRARVR